MKAIITYLEKRKTAILTLLKKPKETYTRATFHQLRVELKKLQSVFDIIEFCIQHFKLKKMFKPIQEVFDLAGSVREIQLEESMLKKYFFTPSLKGYKTDLRNLRFKKEAKFFSTVNKPLMTRLEKIFSSLITSLSEIDRNKATKYMDEERKKINKFLHQPLLQPTQIHDLRKRLKTFDFTRKSLNLEKKYKAFPKKNILPDLLGEWHDGQVMIQHLNKAMDMCGKNPKEILQLEKIKNKISASDKKIFLKINKTIASTQSKSWIAT